MRLLDTVDLDASTPGWVPIALVLVLALACVGLYLNMRKHIRMARANDPTAVSEESSPADQE